MGPSKTPTVAEATWMSRAQRIGCLACRQDGHYSEAEIHHIVSGNKRMGHFYTLPLCPSHHRHGTEHEPSVHPWKKRFEAKYGTQLELLAKLQVELGVYDKVTT
jgi:hypothetical protein